MIDFYPSSIYYPREAVEEKLAKGELQKTEKHLLDWTDRHRGEIWDCAREDSDNPTDEILLDNLRALLLCKGSLQPAADLGDVLKEIKNEIWYRNEKGPEDNEEVSLDWRKEYLPKWREARMFEAFILIEKKSAHLLEILKG
ncbi:MAG: hypothetical protein HUK21_04140 [Fibrobacteraceae bacterium]|nr:hypothetical protein [Fibrobacteraceae bacterium]